MKTQLRAIIMCAVLLAMTYAPYSPLSPFEVAGASSGSIPTNGSDWVINQNTVIEDGDYWVKNITVQTGYTLVIRDSTIKIRSYAWSTSAFVTQYHSALKIFNSTVESFDFRNWKGTWAGQYLYTPPEGSRGFFLQVDNSSIKGFAGHFYDATNALTISTPLAGSYIHNSLFTGHIQLYPDVPMMNGTYGDIDIDGLTFWGVPYCLLINRVSGSRPLNIKNLILTRGFVMGADYPVSNAQYGAGGAGAITNFTNPAGYYYTSTQIPNRTADLYTPNMYNIRYGVKYNILRTAKVYAYDDHFNALTGARLVITNADGVFYNATISGSAQVNVLVAKNSTTPLAYYHLYKYPITFRIYNSTYDYTRTVTQGEWESTANVYEMDYLYVCSNRLNITRNKFPDNYDFGWTFASDCDNSDSVVTYPVAEYMTSLGMGATWTFWAYNQNPSDPVNRRCGPGLLNTSRVQVLADWLRAHGHSVGAHTVAGTNDTRTVWIEAFDAWESTMGWFPVMTYDHSNNVDNQQLVGSKGSDPALPRTYYNIDYTATHFDYDRYGALPAGYQPDTYKYPYGTGSGALYYIMRVGANSTEMENGSVRGMGYGYLPQFPISTYNDATDRIFWYQFYASGMDAPWQYSLAQYSTLNTSRGIFIGSGHWGTVAHGATGGNGWVRQVNGTPANVIFNPASPIYTPWDINAQYVINTTATSGISGKSLFDSLSVMNGYFVPVDTMLTYIASLDGVDWLEDIRFDLANDNAVKRMGGVVVVNEGNRLRIENRNPEAVNGFGVISNRTISLANGSRILYPNQEYEINFGRLPAYSRAYWTLSESALGISTSCWVANLTRSGASLHINMTNEKNGAVTVNAPAWMDTGWYEIMDLTTGQSYVTQELTFSTLGGHSYRITEAERPAHALDPRNEESREEIYDFVVWAFAIGILLSVTGIIVSHFRR